MLYSQFAWLLANLTDGDGTPTKAQQELADDLEKQLDRTRRRSSTAREGRRRQAERRGEEARRAGTVRPAGEGKKEEAKPAAGK